MPATQPAAGTSLEITRTIAAPPDKVFDAWTKPEMMTKWFCKGMEGSTVSVQQLELRAGGRLRVDVNDAKGRMWRLHAEYREIKKPERLVFTWRWENEPQFGETLVTVEIRRLGTSNFSELKLRHEGFPTAEACKGHYEGWFACFNMLDKELPMRAETSLEITRTIAAPIEKVFDAFTKPEIMERWFTRGVQQNQVVKVTELDLQVGGKLRLDVTTPKGEVYRLLCEYREIERPRRLLFTFAWTSHPEHGDSFVIVDLESQGANRTEVRFRQQGFLSAKAARDHEGGWIECFDVLEKELAAFWN